MGTHLALHIADEKFHFFRRIMGFSISLSMEERKFEIELVSDGRDTANSGLQPQLRILKKSRGETMHRLAPPASGLTMIAFFQPGICRLM